MPLAYKQRKTEPSSDYAPHGHCRGRLWTEWPTVGSLLPLYRLLRPLCLGSVSITHWIGHRRLPGDQVHGQCWCRLAGPQSAPNAAGCSPSRVPLLGLALPWLTPGSCWGHPPCSSRTINSEPRVLPGGTDHHQVRPGVWRLSDRELHEGKGWAHVHPTVGVHLVDTWVFVQQVSGKGGAPRTMVFTCTCRILSFRSPKGQAHAPAARWERGEASGPKRGLQAEKGATGNLLLRGPRSPDPRAARGPEQELLLVWGVQAPTTMCTPETKPVSAGSFPGATTLALRV